MNRFKQILTDAADLVERKNHDYQGSYATIRKKYGAIAFHVRIADKLARIEQLNKAEAKVDESIFDTLRDIIGYCILEIAYLTKRGFKEIVEPLLEMDDWIWGVYQSDRVKSVDFYNMLANESWGYYEKHKDYTFLEGLIQDTAMEILYREGEDAQIQCQGG